MPRETASYGGKAGHAHRHHNAKAPHHVLSSHAAHVKGDAMAHDTHHKHNKEHGAGSFDSPEHYQDGGMDHHLGCNGEAD